MIPSYYVHPSAYVDEPCTIGAGTQIWHLCHVMIGARIGERCILGQNVHVGLGTPMHTVIACVRKAGGTSRKWSQVSCAVSTGQKSSLCHKTPPPRLPQRSDLVCLRRSSVLCRHRASYDLAIAKAITPSAV
jgi:hypothetical protein